MRNYFLWMSKESVLEMESTPSEYTVKTKQQKMRILLIHKFS